VRVQYGSLELAVRVVGDSVRRTTFIYRVGRHLKNQGFWSCDYFVVFINPYS
jgi:hypothetical protein